MQHITRLAHIIGSRHGVAGVSDLRAARVTQAQVDSLVRHRLLTPMLPGAYLMAGWPESIAARCRALCVADSEAAITGAAAAHLWQVRRGGPVLQIEARVSHFRWPWSVPWVQIRRCNVLDPIDVVDRIDGIRVVSPPRLVFDLAANVQPVDLESVVEQVLDRGWCSIPTLHDFARRLCHPARPGSRRFADVLASRPAWLRPADSHLEVVVFDGLRRLGVAGLVRQERIDLRPGWSIHLDVAVPEIRWGVAVDHVTWHGGRVDAQRDKRNDRLARLLGWTIERVTDEDLCERPSDTCTELADLYRMALARSRSAAS
jgi:hypothetical protein